jgi:hypothetical protein
MALATYQWYNGATETAVWDFTADLGRTLDGLAASPTIVVTFPVSAVTGATPLAAVGSPSANTTSSSGTTKVQVWQKVSVTGGIVGQTYVAHATCTTTQGAVVAGTVLITVLDVGA